MAFLDLAAGFLERLPDLAGLQADEHILLIHEQPTHVPDDLATRRGVAAQAGNASRATLSAVWTSALVE